MFDPETKDQPLPQRLARALIIGAVVVLVVIGGFTLIRDQFTEEEPAAAPSAEPSPEPTATPAAPDRSTVDEVDDWFPHSRAEFAEAGQAAEDFLGQVATIDFTRDDFEAHSERLGDHATDTQAVTLTTADGIAEGVWRVLGQDTSVDTWTGQADVDQVRAYDPSSIHFLMSLEADPEGEADPKDLGEYLVIMTRTSGGTWTVELAERFNG
ncbi:hypothetical protein [Nocardiopsis deserti]|uniref:hypothetical protein n=1 Tax=Nocardiopsis deserti TaxID=2605988 RepID=UPI00123C0C9B|nr:hypothetical protein [Nocardiopsis deserti]